MLRAYQSTIIASAAAVTAAACTQQLSLPARDHGNVGNDQDGNDPTAPVCDGDILWAYTSERMLGMRFQQVDLVDHTILDEYAERWESPRIRRAATQWLRMADDGEFEANS